MNAIHSSKWRSAKDAIGLVTSGMTVAIETLSAEPLALTAALWEHACDLKDLTVLTGLLADYPFATKARENVRLRCWFLPGTLMKGATGEIKAEFLPLNIVQTFRFLQSTPTDLALVQVSPANAQGMHSLGINTSFSRAMLRSAKLVIAEVNDAMPFAMGDSLVHESELDILVATNRPLPESSLRVADDAIDLSIGLRAAKLVQDGSTVALGIGSIPGAFVEGLIQLGRQDLLLINLLTDAGRKLIESGCCGTQNPKAVVGDVMGTRELYRWLANNPAIHMADALATHSVESLHARKNFVSVSSALEIDLYSQANSEWLGGKQAGGIGGSMDFAIGAQFEGGLSIFALRSTTSSGASRIVPRFKGDGPITIPRTLVQVVVTEYGVADLRKLSVRERALALASIAHPSHRQSLVEAAAQI